MMVISRNSTPFFSFLFKTYIQYSNLLFGIDNHRANTILSQLNFLSDLIKKLGNEDERHSVIEDLEEIRSILTEPKNIALHLSVNVRQLVKKFENPGGILLQMVPEKANLCQKR